MPEHRGIHRHVAGVHQEKTLSLYLAVDYSLKSLTVSVILGQEHHPDAIPPLLRHRYAVKQYVFMRNLHHDARTVTRLVVGALRASVCHVLQHLQPLVYYGMMLAAIDLYHKPDATAVMLVGW